jgi:MscS family membrane protein
MNFRSICLLACLLCLGLAAPLAGAGENPPTLKQVIGPKKAPPAAETAPQKPAAPDKPSAPAPAPEAGGAQESPRSVMLNFVQAARQGDYKTAATYLDLSSIPKEQWSEEGPHLAYRLMAAGTHTMWLALETLSPNPKGNLKDGLPPDREKIGTIDVPNGSVDLILHRVRGPGHKHRWLISPGTVSQIDLLYRYHGYGPLGETLSKLMPDRWVLGMQVWQWAALFVLAALCYLAAWGITALTVHLLARRAQGLGAAGKRLLRGPLRLLLTALFFSWSVDLVSPSVTFMAVMKGHSLITAAVLWCLLCLVDLTRDRLTRRLREAGNQ